MLARPRLIVLGRPGAGKGTQCARLSRHYGVPHISTGEILRAAVRDGAAVAAQATAHMDAGNLVPDDVMVEMVQLRLGADDAREGFVLDGFPRTVPQAEALLELTDPRGLDLVVELQVDTEVALARLAERWAVAAEERRSDDADAVAARRLSLHDEQAMPVADWFARRGLLVVVDGVGPLDEVTQRLLAVVEQSRAGLRR